MFIDPNNPDPNLRDYHISLGSPCINAGDPNYISKWGELDIDGQSRVSSGIRIDVGADDIQLPAIKLIVPIGSEVWAAKSEHKIKWQSSDVLSNLALYYSTDAGLNWDLIADNVPNTGEYTWRLPKVNSDVCMLRIEPVIPDANTVYAGFDKKFTIHSDKRGHTVGPVWPTENRNFRHTSNSRVPGPELGCTKWQFTTDSQLAGSPVIGKNNNIHLLCISGKLYTLDANGNQLWAFDANSTVLSSPAVGPDGSIYFGNENGRLFAISPQGSVRWTSDTFALGAYTPAVSPNGKIYFGSADGTFYCLAPDGSEKWHYTIPSNGYWIAPILTPPATGPYGTVYFGGLSPVLYAANANTGRIKWTRNFGRLYNPMDANSNYTVGGSIFSSPVIADDGTVYISPVYDSNLYALNPADGSIIWQTLLAAPTWGQDPPPRYQNPTVWSTPALGPDGTIYVSCDDPNLRAIDPNGSVKWTTRLGMIGAFTLSVGSDGLIYAASDDRQLYVVDSFGCQVARFEGQNWLSFPVITDDSELIVADANSIVYCLSAVCDGNTQSLHRPEDVSRDSQINFTDFAPLAEDWLDNIDDSPSPYIYIGLEYYLPGDIDRNGYVDTNDLYLLSVKWLQH
jgi:outer membrane protein assembly factor BamB